MTIKDVILEIENVENQLSSMMVEDAKTDLNLLKNQLENQQLVKFTADNLGSSPMIENLEIKEIKGATK